jgi:hypothetical protein
MRTLSRATLLAALPFIIGSCGAKNDPGQFLSMKLTPNATIVGPGPDMSCADLLAQKAIASTGVPASRSVVGPLLRFNEFEYTWDSTETLYISAIRVSIEGSGIANRKQVITLSSDEAALLSGETLGIVSSRGTRRSNDPTRDSDTTKVRCSLVVGGFSLLNGAQTSSFRARVQVEIIGTAEANTPEKTLRFVRQKVVGYADYIAF